MKNNRIVKTLRRCIGGMLILLIGLGAILLPLSANQAHAASVQVKDDARVLDVDQVRSKASQLSHPVSISTVPTFDGPKSDFIRNTQQALTGQDAIAIGISVEQRYLAIVAGKQVGLNAEQTVEARQAFAQAYGSNAGANGNYTAATLAALQSLQASLGTGSADGIANPLQSLGGVLSNPLTWLLLLLALTGTSFFVLRRFSGQQNTMNPTMGMPWQERPGPKDEYGRVDPDPGYGQSGYGRPPYSGSGYDPNGYYGRPMYGPGYPPQGGVNPWVAGGMGALGGGLLGYGLGRMAGEHEQQAQGADSMNPDTITPLSQGNYDPGMNYPVGSLESGNGPDFGGFGGEGADFGGGGDFGSGSDW
jgi:hypothetical protein